MLSTKHKLRIWKIVQFGNIWLVFGVVYSFIEKGLIADAQYYPGTGNPYSFERSLIINGIATSCMGMLHGIIEFYILRKYFINLPFLKKNTLKTIIYLFIIILFILCLNSIYNSNALHISLVSTDILKANLSFIKSFSFLSIIFFVASLIILCLLFSEISDYIGQNVLTNFFTGKYHRSVTEERIFMFLDMKSSTSIAEKLGHVEYYKLLNRYYGDMTNAILDSSGEIYQYAGDNIIISWKLKNGSKNTNSIDCFFKIKDNLQTQSVRYEEDFGVIPAFKAAIHCGRVTTGEIGVIKKEIIFTGDVLNTTDRIQNLCNQYNVDLLVSESLLAATGENRQYEYHEIGLFELKGKDERVKVYTLTRQ